MVWLYVALVVVGLMVAVAIAMGRRPVKPDPYADIDVGTVSEHWLAEQRGSKH